MVARVGVSEQEVRIGEEERMRDEGDGEGGEREDG